MTQLLIEYVEWGVRHAYLWGFLMVFVLMTIESSFVPFPSEVVMIPAGFLAYREALFFASGPIDVSLVILLGLLGSLVGAYLNYYLSLKLGRPFLERYGRYFFLSPATIARAIEIFNRHGEIATFVCRLLPGIRQLISIPAGLSQMPLKRFTLFTALGAGIWCVVLTVTGYYLGALSGEMSYADLVIGGKESIKAYYPMLFIGLFAVVALYVAVQKKVMSSNKVS